MSIRKMIEEIFSGKLTESTDSFKQLISEKVQGKLKKSKKEMQMDCTNERDEGKPGKMFDVIAAKAAKEYGSVEAGKKVAGAIRKKVLAKE